MAILVNRRLQGINLRLYNTSMNTFDKLWERHKNPASWIMRPLFGAVMFYGAWLNSWLLLVLGIFSLGTSWFWFPKPKRIHAWVERFIDVEKQFITPPWELKKVLSLVFVLIFLVIVTVAFWQHDARLALVLFIFGALYKAFWSLYVSRRAGIPAASIGVISAILAAVALCFLY